MQKEQQPVKGVSLRTLYSWLIVAAVLISLLMVYFTFHLSGSFRRLSEATDEYIRLEKAAYELMDASDFLTEKAQRFTADGKLQYLNEYFAEAFETNRREDAIAKMSENPSSAAALAQLQEAMDGSKALMAREYYAMKLVIEAKGYVDYPEVLRDVTLSAEDAALNAGEKMTRATVLLLSEEYYREKDEIRANMRESLEALEKLTRDEEQSSNDALGADLDATRIVIVLQTVGILGMVWLTSRLGIHPVLKAVERIKDDSPIPEVGANEFRYLARTYNKMYSVYKRSVEHLNYKASHDELTRVYNRAGYDLLLSGLNMKTTYMLVIDIDDFKLVNDTYGHETGDRVLRKAAEVLESNFRNDDYVCRIGGDEFVVLMVHANQGQQRLIASKLRQINEDLAAAAVTNGLPKVTISAGVAHGTQAPDAAVLFELADQALYTTKRSGKNGYTFVK